jgi:hypothetical protein
MTRVSGRCALPVGFPRKAPTATVTVLFLFSLSLLENAPCRMRFPRSYLPHAGNLKETFRQQYRSQRWAWRLGSARVGKVN